jgi:hypothetical protein
VKAVDDIGARRQGHEEALVIVAQGIEAFTD